MAPIKILSAVRAGEDHFVAAVEPGMRGRWCLIFLGDVKRTGKIAPSVQIGQGGESKGADIYYPSRLSGLPAIARYWSVMYLPVGTRTLSVEFPGADPDVVHYKFSVCPISRAAAAVLIVSKHPLRFIRMFSGGGIGIGHRVRALLATLPTDAGKQRSYATWQTLFDTWGEANRQALMGAAQRSAWPTFSVLVFNPAGEASPALEATLKALAVQWLSVPYSLVTGAGGDADDAVDRALENHPSDYILVLQAGEILPPHAVAVLADSAVRYARPDVLYADEDEVTPAGRRHAPHFKPEVNHALMLSGTLSRGVWAIRQDVVRGRIKRSADWAETFRLDIWLRLYEAKRQPHTRRVPFVLTHRRTDTELASPGSLAAIVTGHLKRSNFPAEVDGEAFPLRVHFKSGPDGPKVSIIVPTMGRSPHVLRCLKAVLSRTSYKNFEFVVIIAQGGDLDPVQERTLESLKADARTKVILFDLPQFNYSRANNYAIEKSDGELICLLNDDVEPIDEDWLERMIGHLADPSIGAVGAKLLYGNNTVQHGGVIAGLGGVADHMNRFLSGDDPGYSARAVLNQEVSAVTGACLLVPRTVFHQVGGLNEDFPVAYNDTDFCLKIREAGYGIIFSAETRLFHYESLSFLKHYADDRIDQHPVEVSRMLARWGAICAADPFHNPNLSLGRGNEWKPAFPPRIKRPGNDG
ncbi:MAG: glycosyltransferase [Parvibaculaceae bacterium]|nr:glycosyltransferase [Parvibaculaceae bacterium]